MGSYLAFLTWNGEEQIPWCHVIVIHVASGWKKATAVTATYAGHNQPLDSPAIPVLKYSARNSSPYDDDDPSAAPAPSTTTEGEREGERERERRERGEREEREERDLMWRLLRQTCVRAACCCVMLCTLHSSSRPGISRYRSETYVDRMGPSRAAAATSSTG